MSFLLEATGAPGFPTLHTGYGPHAYYTTIPTSRPAYGLYYFFCTCFGDWGRHELQGAQKEEFRQTRAKKDKMRIRKIAKKAKLQQTKHIADQRHSSKLRSVVLAIVKYFGHCWPFCCTWRKEIV